MIEERQQHLVRFYSILADLEKIIGGARTLADCRDRMAWPARGIYFFREAGEKVIQFGGCFTEPALIGNSLKQQAEFPQCFLSN